MKKETEKLQKIQHKVVTNMFQLNIFLLSKIICESRAVTIVEWTAVKMLKMKQRTGQIDRFLKN